MRQGSIWERSAVAAILVAPVLLIAWSFWPGMMSPDSFTEIAQADTGVFNNQHAPLLTALWYPLYQLGFGPGWILLAQVAAVASGSYLLLRSALEPKAAALVAALIMISPVVFGMLGYFSRDVWFTAFVLLAFGSAVRFVREDRRTVWLVIGVASCWLALAARQNAPPVVVLALGIFAAGLVPATVRMRPLWVAGAALLATLVMMGSQVLANSIIGTEDVNPEQVTMSHDLLEISYAVGENLVPPSILSDRTMKPIRGYRNPQFTGPFVFGEAAPAQFPLPEAKMEDLREAWRSAITEHPWAYAKQRFDMTRRLLAAGYRANWIYYPQIDANAFGLTVRNPEANAQARDYVEGFADPALTGGILYTLWVYQLAALVAAAYLWRRVRTPEAKVVALLAVATVGLQAGLSVSAPGAEYRFEFPMVVWSLIAVACAVASRGRPDEGTPA